MAQAPSGPPDISGSAAAQPNTDELLSQLAGSEIDRLLAESETERPPAEPAKPQTATKTPDPAPAIPAAEKKKASAIDKELESSVASELDNLFQELQGGETPAPADKPKEEAPPEAVERAALLEAAGFDGKGAEAKSGASPDPVHEADRNPPERAAVLRAAGFNADEAFGPAAGADGPLPIYLKPLEWINTPLANCPPTIRQMMGRAGIVTLINALLVLGYVVFFRKH